MNHKAILFDLDDTLTKTWVVKFRQHKFVAKKYYDVEFNDETLREHWGKPMSRLIADLYGGLGPVEVAEANYIRHAADFPKELQEDTLSTLEALRESGLKLGLVTSWWRHRLQDDFNSYGMPMEHFAVIQGSEDTEHHKPDPRVFEPALKKLKEQGITSGIVYVGDALMDYEAARDAGLHFVGVTTGMVDAKTFKKAGTKNVISKLSELPAALNL